MSSATELMRAKVDTICNAVDASGEASGPLKFFTRELREALYSADVVKAEADQAAENARLRADLDRLQHERDTFSEALKLNGTELDRSAQIIRDMMAERDALRQRIAACETVIARWRERCQEWLAIPVEYRLPGHVDMREAVGVCTVELDAALHPPERLP